MLALAPMIEQFAISAVMVIVCVVIHGLGLFALASALRTETAEERLRRVNALSPRGVAFTLAIVVAMLVLHGLEIWAFTAVYVLTGAIPGLKEALYFSTISYSTVGYNDTHIAEQWRLLGAFESILGMVLLGWSTAFFFRMLGRMEAH